MVNLIDAHAAHPCSCGGLHGSTALMVRMSQAHASAQQQPLTFCSAAPTQASKVAAHCPRSARCDTDGRLCCRPQSQQEEQAAQRRDRGQWQAGTTGGKARAAATQCRTGSPASPPATWRPGDFYTGIWVCAHVSCTSPSSGWTQAGQAAWQHVLPGARDAQARQKRHAASLTRPAQHEQLPSLPAGNGSHGAPDGGKVPLDSTAACTAAHHKLELCANLHPRPAVASWLQSAVCRWPQVLTKR